MDAHGAQCEARVDMAVEAEHSHGTAVPIRARVWGLGAEGWAQGQGSGSGLEFGLGFVFGFGFGLGFG